MRAPRTPFRIQEILLAALLLALTAIPASAQAGDEVGRTVIPETVVTAKRHESESSRVTSAIDRLTRDDLERRQTSRLEDVISELPGVYVQSAGPPGQSSGLVIRGTSPFHTLVLVDGIPMNNSVNAGLFDFSGFTATAVERVEVLRGSYGLLYGSEAIGGVVDIRTRRGRGSPNGFVLLEGGSFGTHREAVGVGGAEDRFDFHLTLGNLVTSGDRDREGHRASEAVGNFGLVFSGWAELRATVYLGDATTEFPFAQDTRFGGPLPEEPNEEQSLSRRAAGLTLDLRPADWFDLSLHGSLLDIRWNWDDGPNEPTFFDPDGIPENGDEFSRRLDEFHGVRDQTDSRLRASGTLRWNDLLGWGYREEGWVELEITTGVEYVTQRSRESSAYPDPGATDEPRWIDTTLAGETSTTSWFALLEAAGPDLEFLRDIVANAGFRRDRHSAFGGHDSVFFGGRMTFAPTATTIRSAYGEGFRAPKAFELSDPYIGNRDLGPETSESFDIGASQPLFDGVVVQATWFTLDVSNVVLLNGQTWMLENFGPGTKNRGFEFQAVADLGDGFRVRGTLTAQDRRGPKGQRIGVRRFGSFGISWHAAPWEVSLDGYLSTALENGGGEFTSPDAEERRHPGRRNLWSLSIRYQPEEWLSVFGRVENLLDDDYVALNRGVPKGLPIGAYLGVRLDW